MEIKGVPYEKALKKILSGVRQMEAEACSVEAALCMTAAEDVKAGLSLPAADTVGPDGYAVRASDIQRASKSSPAVLKITGTARAGRPFGKKLMQGQAVRVMTGSLLPDGADCVVRFEDTDEPAGKNGPNLHSPAEVRIYVSAHAGEGVRPAGSSIRQSQTVLKKGTRICPAQAAVLSGIGLTSVKVYGRPSAAVIITGDEVTSPGRKLAPGQIYDFNRTAVVSALTRCGAVVKTACHAPDREEVIIKQIQKAVSADADFIVTTGGVSMGDYDLMRLVLSKIGKTAFEGLTIGPGRSFVFGSVQGGSGKDIPVFALSGPPLGCMANLELLVKPAVLKMLGCKDTEPAALKATALSSVEHRAPVPVSFVKWVNIRRLENGYGAELNLGEEQSGFAYLAAANGFIILRPGMVIRKGDEIEVYPFEFL